MLIEIEVGFQSANTCFKWYRYWLLTNVKSSLLTMPQWKRRLNNFFLLFFTSNIGECMAFTVIDSHWREAMKRFVRGFVERTTYSQLLFFTFCWMLNGRKRVFNWFKKAYLTTLLCYTNLVYWIFSSLSFDSIRKHFQVA